MQHGIDHLFVSDMKLRIPYEDWWYYSLTRRHVGLTQVVFFSKTGFVDTRQGLIPRHSIFKNGSLQDRLMYCLSTKIVFGCNNRFESAVGPYSSAMLPLFEKGYW